MADIVICVHNALEDVRRCLASVWRDTDPRHTVIIVDDASAPECHETLAAFVRSRPGTVLIRNDGSRGYTKAANQGLRRSTADLVVLLNSDTVVTPGWLEGLIDCAQSDLKIGIVGPLSNAAGYQSIPRRFTGTGAFAVNLLPPGWSPRHVANIVATLSTRAFPRIGVINGFCFGITRAVIETIAYLDEGLFPDAYGEETDYCLRAVEMGFELAVAEHVYVYHAKSRSYTQERRHALAQRGEDALRQRHGQAALHRAYAQSHHEPTLARMRQQIRPLLSKKSPPSTLEIEQVHVGNAPGAGDGNAEPARTPRDTPPLPATPKGDQKSNAEADERDP